MLFEPEAPSRTMPRGKTHALEYTSSAQSMDRPVITTLLLPRYTARVHAESGSTHAVRSKTPTAKHATALRTASMVIFSRLPIGVSWISSKKNELPKSWGLVRRVALSRSSRLRFRCCAGGDGIAGGRCVGDDTTIEPACHFSCLHFVAWHDSQGALDRERRLLPFPHDSVPQEISKPLE